ncbi:ribonuclease H-like domain, reverse transcriptase, RNA-dependent DNA polymerase [Tanacetum coccineum]
MTVNKSFLTDYQEVDGGFVAFARSPKGGKITGKGKIRTEKLDFEDVYFVKELKYQDDTQNNNLLPLLYDRPQSIRMQLPDDAGKNTIEEPRIEGGSKHAIGTKWVYRNKKDERGIVVRNKAKLVAQGYTQEEGINYNEDFAPVLLGYKQSEFESLMHKKFQMSSLGELTFFLGMQVMQKDDGIFISQDKYMADILKKFDFVTVKTASTPIETNKAML